MVHIASEGQLAPGGGGFVAFGFSSKEGAFGYLPSGTVRVGSINGHGDIAFAAVILGGPGPRGVVLFANDTLGLVLREGQDIAAGSIEEIGDFFLTDNGAIVFDARVDGSPPVPTELVVAQYGSAPDVTSTVLLTYSSSTKTASGMIEAFDDDGQPLLLRLGENPESFEVPFDLDPLGTLSLPTRPSPLIEVGWVLITTDPVVDGSILFEVLGSGIAGVGISPTMTAFLAPMFRNVDTGLSTGFALANPNDVPVEITLTLQNGAGEEIVGSRVVILLKDRNLLFKLRVASTEMRVKVGRQRAMRVGVPGVFGM